MRASLRISAFTVAAYVVLAFLAGAASELAGDPTRPHNVVLTIELTAFFVAAFVPVECPSVGARLRRGSAVLLGGSGATVSFLLLVGLLRRAFLDGDPGVESVDHPALLVALKAAAFLLCMVSARAVSLLVLREGTREHEELEHAVGEEKHA